MEEVEERLFNERVEIINFGLESEHKAFSVRRGSRKYICIDNDKIKNNRDRICTLEHEYEHLVSLDLMYSLDASPYEVYVKERKINRRLIKRLIPYAKLKPLLQAQKPLYEIAEELEVTEELLHQAIEYYKDLECTATERSNNEDDVYEC